MLCRLGEVFIWFSKYIKIIFLEESSSMVYIRKKL